MNFIEELKTLDANDIGRWPFAFRAGVIAIVFVLILGLGVYWTIIEDKAPQLTRAQAEEKTLRITFENKQRKAANYDAYKAQLAQMEQSFGTMLRQLPGKTEIRISTRRSRLRSAFPVAITRSRISSAALHRCREL